MKSGPAKAAADEAPASIPQTAPPGIGYGHPEYQFVQAILEMQKSIGGVQASVDALRETVERTETKVDDLVSWKHKIVGGVAVLSVVVTLIGFVIGLFWDYVYIKPPVVQAVIEQPAQATQPSSVPGAKK